MNATVAAKHTAYKHKSFFDTIYKNNYKKIYNYIFTLTKNPHITEDISQDTFMALYNSLDFLINHPNIEAWLFKTSKNKLCDYYRKKSNNEIPLSNNDLETIDIYNDRTNIYLELENVLSKEEINDLMLRFEHGYTIREIAEGKGKSVASYKMKFNRLFKKLKKSKLFFIFLLPLIYFKRSIG